MKRAMLELCQQDKRSMIVLQHADVSGMHAVIEQLTLWSVVQERHQPSARSTLLQKHLT